MPFERMKTPPFAAVPAPQTPSSVRRMKPVLADLARRNLSGYFIIDLNNPGKVTVQLRDFRVPVKVSGGVRA